MSVTTGPNLGLMIAAAQGDVHYTEFLKFLRGVDALVQPFVLAQQSTPPGTPADGDLYIVGNSPTGAWSGKAQQLARWWSGGPSWEFFVPRNRWSVVLGTSFYIYNGTAWVPSNASPTLSYNIPIDAQYAYPVGQTLIDITLGGSWTIDPGVSISVIGSSIGSGALIAYFYIKTGTNLWRRYGLEA